MFKKTVSILLSALIIFSTLAINTFSAGAETVTNSVLKSVTFDEGKTDTEYKLITNNLKIRDTSDSSHGNALYFVPSAVAYTSSITLDFDGAFYGNDPTIYSVKTEVGHRYRISCDYKFEGTKPNYLFIGYVYENQVADKREQVRIGGDPILNADTSWKSCSIELVADTEELLSFYVNAGKNIPVGIFIDNIKIEEITPAVTATTDLSYCEKPYNIFTDVNTPITVTAGHEYTFGADIVGNTGDAVYLSANGTDYFPLYANVSYPKVNATKIRYEYKFIAPPIGTIYIMTKNNSGNLSLTDVCLFKSKSISTDIAMGKDSKPKEYTPSEQTMDTLATEYSDIFANATEVNIGGTAVNENFKGINGIYSLYNGLTDKFGREYTDEQTELEFDRLQDMGITMVRSYYGSGLVWDSTTQSFDFSKNNKEFQAFVKNCKELEKRGIEVGITPTWSLKSLLTGKTATTNGAATNVDIGNAYGILSGDALKDAEGKITGTVDETIYEATLEKFSNFVKESVIAFEANGVKNIKYMFAFTESNNTFNDFNNFKWDDPIALREYEKLAPLYKKAIIALDKGLKDAGNNADGISYRSQYKIVAPCDNNRGDDVDSAYKDGSSYLVEYTLNDEQLKGIVDIIGSHNGYCKDYSKSTGQSYQEDIFAKVANTKLSATLEDANEADMEYWVDEYNVAAESASTDLDNAYKGTALGSMVTAAMNMGVSNVFLWSLADQQWPNNITYNNDGFVNGMQKIGYMPSFFESYTPYKSWYALSLITKYMGAGKVYSANAEKSGIYASFVERNDGHKSLLVVNYNNSDANLKYNFTNGLGNKTVYKYVYNPNTVTPTYEAVMIDASAKADVTDTLYDTLGAYEVAVYTTQGTEIENDTVMDFATVEGTSIKLNSNTNLNTGDNRSGIRFKNNVDNVIINSDGLIKGYTVVEYGTVVMSTDVLGDVELTLDTEINKDNKIYRALSGAAYKTDYDGTAEKNIVYKQHEFNRDFTAVLYNIGYSSSNDTINYEIYGRRYTTRVYAKLMDNITGAIVNIYDDDIQFGSIFDVFYEIEQIDLNQITDEEIKSEKMQDKESVASWLELDKGAIKPFYDNWQRKMGYKDLEFDVGDM